MSDPDGRELVMAALGPTMAIMESYAGFSVKYADAPRVADGKDRTTVEVHLDLTCKDRHAREVQMITQALKDVEMRYERKDRGGRRVWAVDVGEGGPRPRADPDDTEQAGLF